METKDSLPCLEQPSACPYVKPDQASPSPHPIHLTFKRMLVRWCTNRLNFQGFYILPYCVYLLCIYLRTNSHINWSVFITEMKSVYCAVRIGSLN